ncbi:MAG: flagellar basal body rod protein FlgC [Candidatus Eisenbacteria bacterium]|nr:flagellar basal body rod protein FlgC [Candidatus Latescibacterota bacterium]MBD3301270.1 flagellar basal body rod protein FlgC [Candidatus Eisenbacteria bacterium]
MPSLARSAEGMAVQAKFMEIIAANIANAQTTKTPEGTAYRRQVGTCEVDPETGRVSIRVDADPRPGRLVYDPGHPDADEKGFVERPNVDVTSEMVDLMLARRLHEANAVVFKAAKSMLRRALEI